MVRRRSITLDEDVDAGILKYRGASLTKEPYEDLNNTRAINELLREILTQKGYIK